MDFKLQTVMRIDEDDNGKASITFKVIGFPSKEIAGIYAAQLMVLRDADMHGELSDYETDIDKGTLH